MTDDDIATPGILLSFPNGHLIQVDSLWHGQVCYRAWHPGKPLSTDQALRMIKKDFVALVRAEGGVAAMPEPPLTLAEPKYLDSSVLGVSPSQHTP